MANKQYSVAIIGGGPAGLMAAETAVGQGACVTIYDHKPSVGRKFLVAGKSGLNLTNDASFDRFCENYSGSDFPKTRWRGFIEDFDNAALRDWARGLGVDTFVAGGGKVFPVTKKAAPLLRRWVARLRADGVQFLMKHQWCAMEPVDGGYQLSFKVESGLKHCVHDRVILALGGGSWPQTGSDGSWVETLQAAGVRSVPLEGANCGWECHWSPETLAIAEGQPLHHLEIRAGNVLVRGELMLTRYGLEGTPIYRLGPHLRAMENPRLEIDFKPVFSIEHMIAKMESARRDFYKEARLRWKLTDAMCAILKQQYGEFDNAEDLAHAAKSCRIELTAPRPVSESISSAGGVAWSELDDSLMFKRIPGVYCAGEMIDWEAPTGGFLMQGCFATGRIAGKAAAGAP